MATDDDLLTAWRLIIALIGGSSHRDDLWTEFERALPDEQLDEGQAPLLALTHAVHYLGFGLWFDWREGDLVEQRCRDLFDRRIGWSSAEVDRRDELQFRWDSCAGGVDRGLFSFDQWLQQRDSGYRLIQITTGGDFYVSILQREVNATELINALKRCGLVARRQSAISPDPAAGI